jgi:hypothetical protein
MGMSSASLFLDEGPEMQLIALNKGLNLFERKAGLHQFANICHIEGSSCSRATTTKYEKIHFFPSCYFFPFPPAQKARYN